MRNSFFSRTIGALVSGGLAAVMCGAVSAQTVPVKPLTPSQEVSPKILMAQADVTCDTMVQQQKLITPVHVVLKASTWDIVKDQSMIAADRTKASVTFADVWKQNGKYVWVHAHTFTQGGTQRASQLCFRTDGTLARVKQAETIPALDAAGAVRAYYNTNGALIAKVGAFEENDPALAKIVTSLPYYSVLP
jgi:hypothetical protein